ncbi:hypothetical protein COU74_02885 [Candidatus Peregrinibacteria bacterium CG10_big_fil_rev_8_21_14_0_10_36_19]|nr:MAG: hypothetical protein COU74_02885 [Candidatus Peregrinibacteria bacterium CG10_big_fil_rev_8_21_14_0_10_36_19]
MKKSTALLLTAGLHLASCDNDTNNTSRCASLTEELNIMGFSVHSNAYIAVQGRCSEIENLKAKEHCQKLATSIKLQAMSACMTKQTNQPTTCTTENNKWECRKM